MPSTARAISFTSPTTRTPSALSAFAPPPMASFLRASDSSRSRRLRSSIRWASRAGNSSSGALSSADAAFASSPTWRAALRAVVPVKRLDAAHARRHACLRRHRDQPDVAGAPHMRAAAQLDRPAHGIAAGLLRIVTHGDHAHLVAVFLAEQRARAGCDGVVDRHQPRGDGRVLQHDVVGDVLDALDLGRAHRLGMGEIETQPVGRDQRALLRDMVAEHLAQRLVQQVGRGVILADGAPARMIDRRAQARRRP